MIITWEMMFNNCSRKQYSLLPQDQHSDSDSEPGGADRCSFSLHRLWVTFLLVLFAFVTGFLGGEFIQDRGLHTNLRTDLPSSTEYAQSCPDPPVRREWRSLSKVEKTEYIDAVSCMLSKPSRLGDDISEPNYHDFAHTHAVSGFDVHGTGAFLPYHRYLIALFEQELRSACGFNGSLPYWDWTLDWESLPNAPVFSPVDGFGGDGKAADDQRPDCVTDGAFANLTVEYSYQDEEKHCLARAFSDGKTRGQLSGENLRPEVVEQVLNQPNYGAFLAALEKGPHDQIPSGVGGDFISTTAPNDPVFYLHHAELDRIWWQWQHSQNSLHVNDYGGPKQHGSDEEAQLSDMVTLGGVLGPDLPVKDLMSTTSDVMCYRYW